MRNQKIVSFSPTDPTLGNRVTSPTLLTRKPEKKAPFARKKAIQCANPDSKYTPFTSRLSREKRSPRADNLLPTASLKSITSHLQEEIKYLSPKHAHSALLIPIPDKYPTNSIKNTSLLTAQQNDSIRSNFFSTLDDLVNSDYAPNPSGLSLDSLAGKSYAVETTEHSADWFGLEGENQKLREENKRLEQQVSNLKQELEQQPSSRRCPKCRHFDALERIKSERTQLQRTISYNQQEIDRLQSLVGQLEHSLQEERRTVELLSRELDASREAEEQMDTLVSTLKEKIESDSLQLRYLNIQQDVLKRRKEEHQKMRMECIKKGIERDNLRKAVNQYKEKVDLLRKVIAKGRKENKFNKNEEIEISLELSMDSIL